MTAIGDAAAAAARGELIVFPTDTVYGLAGGVWMSTQEKGIEIARRMRTGQVEVNGGAFNVNAPFGGYKQSGSGREAGWESLLDYTRTKTVTSRWPDPSTSSVDLGFPRTR